MGPGFETRLGERRPSAADAGRLARTVGDAAGFDAAIFTYSAPSTSNPRVWAAGDVTTYPQFTHCAGVYASTAASNAVLGLRRSVDPDRIPRVTFTQPEITAVGIGVEQATASG